MTIPQSKLDEWQQIADKATKRPWIWGQGDNWEPVTAEEHRDGTDGDLVLITEWERPLGWGSPGDTLPEVILYADDILGNADDAAFIAEARSMVPELLAEVARLRKLVNVIGGEEIEEVLNKIRASHIGCDPHCALRSLWDEDITEIADALVGNKS